MRMYVCYRQIVGWLAQTWLWRVVPAVEKTCPDHLKQAYAKSQAEKPGVSGLLLLTVRFLAWCLFHGP